MASIDASVHVQVKISTPTFNMEGESQMFGQTQETCAVTATVATATGASTTGTMQDDHRRHGISAGERDDETTRGPFLVPKADRRRHTRS